MKKLGFKKARFIFFGKKLRCFTTVEFRCPSLFLAQKKERLFIVFYHALL